jgi:hypothetical protein
VYPSAPFAHLGLAEPVEGVPDAQVLHPDVHAEAEDDKQCDPHAVNGTLRRVALPMARQWACSAAEARFPDTEEVPGSIPGTPTQDKPLWRNG